MDTYKLVVIPVEELETVIKTVIEQVLYHNKEQLQEKQAEKLLDRKEASKMLRISLATLHTYIKRNFFPSYKIGGKTLFKESEILDAFKKVNSPEEKQKRKISSRIRNNKE